MKPILLAGPTASGKSALALDWAAQHGGVIINADSMQIYRDWRVLTARPSDAEESAAPHWLYGHIDISEAYSVGRWLTDCRAALAECRDTGKRPIIVGGTGLYFEALTKGLAEIPAIPPARRAEGEAIIAESGLAAFFDQLEALDPETAADIDQMNPHRVLRAWEVVAETGVGLREWGRRTPPPLLPPAECAPFVMVPDRAWLYARCDLRFDLMLEGGALEEARAVLARNPDPDWPGMKAVGAPELLAYLRGEITLDDAAERAKTATRRYAKRQYTWFRNRMKDWIAFDPKDSFAVDALSRYF